MFAGYLEVPHNEYNNNSHEYITGINGQFKVTKDLGQFCSVQRKLGEDKEMLVFHKIPPSFTCILKTRYPHQMKEAVRHFNEFKVELSQSLSKMFEQIPFSAINHLFFRCKEEELEISQGKREPYGLEKYG